jgi:hypothetical protein
VVSQILAGVTGQKARRAGSVLEWRLLPAALPRTGQRRRAIAFCDRLPSNKFRNRRLN